MLIISLLGRRRGTEDGRRGVHTGAGRHLILILVISAFVIGTLGWMYLRTRHGLKPTQRQEKRARELQETHSSDNESTS